MKNIIKLTAALLLPVILSLTGCSDITDLGGPFSEKTLVGIDITKAPDKTEYFIGAPLDLTGIEVAAIYSDDTRERVYIGVNSVRGFDSSTPGPKTVTVTYNEQTAAFTVTVKDVTLTNIEITGEPAKKSYWMYESIEIDGLEVTAFYSDDSTELIDTGELTISGFDSTETGEQQITVTYGGKSGAFIVTVKKSVFTVTFDKNGGDSEASPKTKTVTQPEENVGSLPTPPEKDGYNFTGWNTHADGSGTSFAANSLVTDNFAVYAQWFKPVVTFNSNGGGAIPSQDINYGSTAVKPADPVKNTYDLKFEGWYTDDATFNNLWDFNDTVTVNVALYAKWTPYELGDTGPGGGKVFYRDVNGFTVTGTSGTYYYLEASPEDLNSGIQFGANGDDIDLGNEIGDGKQNTQRILAILNADKEEGAAKLCANYTNNELNDWFLPSADELYYLFLNRDAAGITLQLSSSKYYWSSSEGSSAQNALAYYYSTSINNTNRNRTTENYVRAIRAF